MTNKDRTSPDLEKLYRAKSGRILSVLLKQCQDLDLAEDALQDACMQATQQWPKQGLPKAPEAWLILVARRRLIDKLRQLKRSSDTQLLQELTDQLCTTASNETEQDIPDERLRLIFTCCHPALSEQAQVALTLKTLCGLNTQEIARAFLVAQTTLEQRLVRAKHKIRKAGIRYQVPSAKDLPERLESVLTVIYLIYNESYSAYESQILKREELANEAIRLARLLHSLLPCPPVAGLLALMLLHQSRAQASSNSQHSFVPLAKQDRRLWDSQKMAEGRQILLSTLAEGKIEKYQLQATISALHAEAASWKDTDWQQILAVYGVLYEQYPSPIIKLNQLVALAYSGQAAQALKHIEGLSEELKNYQPFYAAIADLQANQGLSKDAIHSYTKAISLSRNGPERDYLVKQRQKLTQQK